MASRGILHITELPDNVVKHILSVYLTKTQRVIFAVAMTDVKPPSNGASSATHNDILDDEWETLDFEDIESNLAARLSDDDLRAILVCIDAKNVLKLLKLTGCYGIAGSGLGPLRGSTVLEMIDLTLVKQHESPHLEVNTAISVDAVVPILDSIIATNTSCLKHLSLPMKWRRAGGALLDSFLAQYNEYLADQQTGFFCPNCNVNMEDVEGERYETRISHYGVQDFTCSICCNRYCSDCVTENENGEEEYYLEYCELCERICCHDCAHMSECMGCGCVSACQSCYPAYCDECNAPHCKSCKLRHTCLTCDRIRCDDCATHIINNDEEEYDSEDDERMEVHCQECHAEQRTNEG